MAPVDPWIMLEGIGGGVTALGGLYAFVKRLIANQKRKKDAHKANILEEAKAEAEKVISVLREDVRKLEIEFEVQKANVSKDLGHFKEVYNNELKVLGEKIESLRSDIAQQHQALVGLLTRLVDR